jgi:transcription antitermination factor NusG
MEGNWICILLNHQYSKKESLDIVRKEMDKVFGEDNLGVEIAKSGTCDSEGFGYYAFVNCLNYENHVSGLRRSRVIYDVLPSYKSPHFLSEEEVLSFKDSAENEGRPEELFYGDLVKIEDGYLKNLYGIVKSKNDDGTYKVFFKLYTMKFDEDLSPRVLDLQRNIFDKVRVPVVEYHDNVVEIMNMCSKGTIDDKMYRPKHRKHGSEGFES